MKRLTFILIMVLISVGLAQADPTGIVTVDRQAYLDGQTDHSGIKVIFYAASPTAVTDSTFTDAAGYYSQDLEQGIYNITFSKDGYFEQAINGEDIFASKTLPDVTLLAGSIQDVSGSVNGLWTSDNIYNVVGNLEVPEDDTLTIEPGTRVQFAGDYHLYVYGLLIAEGTEADSIVFTSAAETPEKGDWRYIVISSSDNKGSILSYCIVEYAGGRVSGWFTAIYISDSNAQVLNSAVRMSEGDGIIAGSVLQIHNNKIYNNDRWGIHFSYSSSSIISGNMIYDNNYGIYCSDSSPIINGNTIYSNSNYGIRARNSSVPTIKNNIIINNNEGINCNLAPSNLTYNLVYDNNNNFSGDGIPGHTGVPIRVNVNGDSVDAYFNLLQDPELIDPANGDFTLQPGSPCIEAGDGTFTYDETDNHDKGWLVDIGACEYTGATAQLDNLEGGKSYYFGGQVRAKIALAAGANYDSIKVTVHPGENHAQASAAVQRWYEITAEGSGNFDLTLSYKDSELNGQTESELKFWRLAEGGWDGPKLSATTNTAENWLTVEGLSEFSSWIISEANTIDALPVELASFTAAVNGNSVHLKWQTQTETDNYGFELQKRPKTSENSREADWQKIGFVEGHGTSFSAHNYEFFDDLSGNETAVYYRLKQIDLDGSYTCSQEIPVNVGHPASCELLQNYPNPFNPSTNIRFALPEASLVKLVIYNLLGKELETLINRLLPAGNHQAKWNAHNLPSGIYFYRLKTDKFDKTMKFILQK